MIPLFVECTGKRVVIFGGGEVAVRKTGHFAREADVLMVSRTFRPACRMLPVQLQTLNTRTAADSESGLSSHLHFLLSARFPIRPRTTGLERYARNTESSSTMPMENPVISLSRP